jgi:hypothetical protein
MVPGSVVKASDTPLLSRTGGFGSKRRLLSSFPDPPNRLRAIASNDLLARGESMLVRTATCLCLAGAILQGADELRPPDLNKLPSDQFEQLLSESLKNRANPLKDSVSIVTGSNCSIPLLEAKVKRRDRFPMPRIRVRNIERDHMAAVNPAPACKGW